MRVAAVAVLAVSAATATSAAEPGIGRAEILWAGTYRAEVIGSTPQPRTATGKTNQLSHIQKLESTTSIRAKLGASFGFEFRLPDSEALVAMSVTMVVTLPKAGLRNPATQQHIVREEWRPSLRRPGDMMFAGYTLEHPWEIVPGLWTFEIWHEGKKLGEQSFCLLREPSLEQHAEPSGGDEGACPSIPTT